MSEQALSKLRVEIESGTPKEAASSRMMGTPATIGAAH